MGISLATNQQFKTTFSLRKDKDWSMELLGVSNDSCVLSPIPSSRPFTRTLSFNSRASTDTISSVSPLSSSVMFATPSPTAKTRRSHSRSIWEAMKQFLPCYNPVRSKPKSRRKSSKENSVAASKASSMHSVGASPSPDHAYSAMNAEERDENLKAMITYCNKSMKSGQGRYRG